MSRLTDTKIFTAIMCEYRFRTKEGFDAGDDYPKYSRDDGWCVKDSWGLVFGTYSPNVPEIKDYTAKDVIELADDPELHKIFPPPFYVASLDDSADRPMLYFGRHAAKFVSSWVQQPGEYPLDFLVIKPSVDEPAFNVDIMSQVERCHAPEKHVYGCKACLESATSFEGCCSIKRSLCPTEDPLEFKSKWSVGPFLPSRKHTIQGYLYVSPVMLHDSDSHKIVGVKDIKLNDLDFSQYQELYDRRCESLKERQKTLENGRVYCSQCSVQDECFNHFKYKRRYCCNPRPSIEQIASEITNAAVIKLSKRTIAEILEASGQKRVQNPRTGRTSEATIGLADLNRGLGFCVHRVSDNYIMVSGSTDEEWERFKRDENIECYEAGVENLLRTLDDPVKFATLLSCVSTRQSPARATGWGNFYYEYMYTRVRYGEEFSMAFHQPSARRVSPWKIEIKSLPCLFKHYGKIPGSTW